MRIYFTIFFVILITQVAKANLPYMPLRITLEPSQSEYVEGEKISFKVWIKNTDKHNTYPVLLPHRQNTGKKLFYLRVLDMANNYTHVVAIENRPLNNRITGDRERFPKVVQLAPNDSVFFEVNWNALDTIDTENHHTFSALLTAGKYKFQGFYAPDGTTVGDTLYNFISTTNDKKPINKLTFWEGGNPTHPVNLTIKRTTKKNITIENIKYRVERTDRNILAVYYVHDSIMVKTSFFHSNGNKKYELTSNYRNGDPGSMNYSITYFEDGDIKDYYKYDKTHCPSTIFRRTFYNNKQLDFYADIGAHNTFIEKVFNKKGIMVKRYLYSADRKLRTEYRYSPKNGKLKNTEEYKNPCDIVEIR